MNEDSSQSEASLPICQLLEIDKICRQFEAPTSPIKLPLSMIFSLIPWNPSGANCGGNSSQSKPNSNEPHQP